MIISKFVETKVSSANYKRLKELGYDLEPLLMMKGVVQTINQKVEHLLPKSNARVKCICDECSVHYTNRFSRNTDTCNICFKKKVMKGNSYGNKNKGRIVLKMKGSNHPRWNPNKTEYQKYSRQVHYETKKLKHIWGTWENSDKIGLCGIDGAYQLDHKVSIKYGFLNKIHPSVIANIKNLEIVTWKQNRQKHHKNKCDLWDIL
ncbi:hypothetical protein POP12_075 [Pectobacterium phage POP12]|nr:hypothetical protein POP12_075 [Pectobacterium phage POP12]